MVRWGFTGVAYFIRLHVMQVPFAQSTLLGTTARTYIGGYFKKEEMAGGFVDKKRDREGTNKRSKLFTLIGIPLARHLMMLLFICLRPTQAHIIHRRLSQVQRHVV